MKHVLVIEDDILLAKHYERMLSTEYIVTSVGSGIEAINVLDNNAVDAVIIDLLLTGTTAITLLHEMASHTDLAQVPVILVTSLANEIPDIISQFSHYGVRRVLDKTTMAPDDLSISLRAVLE